MTNVSFVETLDLASDDRLRGLRPDLGAKPEIGATRGNGQRAPEAVGKNLRAAVNAGAVVSFVAGLTEGEVSDVLFSTQLAQRAASSKHDRFVATEAWYQVYSDVLARLG